MPAARSKNRWGFTLVEMLVVVAVIALLVGAGIAAYIKFNNRRRVEQAAMDFATYLRTQQKRADAGEKPASCPNTDSITDVLSFYSVTVIGMNPTASSFAWCNTFVQMPAFNLGDRAEFKDDLTVTFYPLGRMPDIDDGETIVADKNNNIKYKVSVSEGGVITVEEEP